MDCHASDVKNSYRSIYNSTNTSEADCPFNQVVDPSIDFKKTIGPNDVLHHESFEPRIINDNELNSHLNNCNINEGNNQPHQWQQHPFNAAQLAFQKITEGNTKRGLDIKFDEEPVQVHQFVSVSTPTGLNSGNHAIYNANKCQYNTAAANLSNVRCDTLKLIGQASLSLALPETTLENMSKLYSKDECGNTQNTLDMDDLSSNDSCITEECKAESIGSEANHSDSSVSSPKRYVSRVLSSIEDLTKIIPKTSLKDSTPSRILPVPIGISEDGLVEELHKVHLYPSSSISTVVEKKSYLNEDFSQADVTSPKKRRRSKHVNKNPHPHSKSKPNHSNPSNGSSKTSLSSITSSQASLLDTRLKSLTNTAFDKHNTSLDSESESTALLSDTSSNISNTSDLSGYGDEYIKIKRLLSDTFPRPEDIAKLMSQVVKKQQTPKPMTNDELENLLHEVQMQKEDLEIQVHRLSVQVQNAIREKELYLQQIEIMNIRITENNQKNYFEVLSQKSNLEGQLEMTKQELENAQSEVTQVQEKLRQSQKDIQNNKAEYDLSKEKEILSNEYSKDMESRNFELNKKLCQSGILLEQSNKKKESLQSQLNEFILKYEKMEQELEDIKSSQNNSDEKKQLLQTTLEQCQEQLKTEQQVRLSNNATIERLSSELNSVKTSRSWYQEQLQSMQNLRSDLQSQLTEHKTNLSSCVAEKLDLETEIKRLKTVAEESKTRLIQEKASLIAHLEGLQADMVEREAVISQMEKERGSESQLMEDRHKKLERDHHLLQKIRLELADLNRKHECLQDDYKYQSSIVSQYEDQLKQMRKNASIINEKLNAKDIKTMAIELKVNEIQQENQIVISENKTKDDLVNSLKEENLELMVSLKSATAEKKEVDSVIIKMKDDINKLSTKVFRMKHDLSCKDRELKDLLSEKQDIESTKNNLFLQYEELKAQTAQKDEDTIIRKDYKILRDNFDRISKLNEGISKELTTLKQSQLNYQIENKSNKETINLKDKQVANMQESIENYREMLLKKDEELFRTREDLANIRKNSKDLNIMLENEKEKSAIISHEIEELTNLEQSMKQEISEMKDCILLERKLKKSLDKKICGLNSEFSNKENEYLNSIDNLKQNLKDIDNRLSLVEGEKQTLLVEIKNAKSINDELNEELLKIREDLAVCRTRNDEQIVQIKHQNSQIEELVLTKEDDIRVLKVKHENLLEKHNNSLRENNEIKSQLNDLKQLLKDMSDNQNAEKESLNTTNGNFSITNNNDLLKIEDNRMDILYRHKITELQLKLSESSARIKNLEEMLTDQYKKSNEMSNIKIDLENLQEENNKFIALLHNKDLEFLEISSNLKLISDQSNKYLSENQTLKQMCDKYREDLSLIETNLKYLTEERDMLITKCESLKDLIPERDTNTQPAVQIDSGASSLENYNIYETHTDSASFYSDRRDQLSLSSSCVFNKTMGDLQQQVTLTSDALHRKDNQIETLTIKLSELQSELNACNLAETPADLKMKHLQTIEKLKLSESKLSSVENDFKEKQRRFESNVRLLTRKLKEHMKGRKEAEKNISKLDQEYKNTLLSEKERNEHLKKCLMELEVEKEYLSGELNILKSKYEESDCALQISKNVSNEYHTKVVWLEKEAGKIKELEISVSNLKQSLHKFEENLSTKDLELNRTKQELSHAHNQIKVFKSKEQETLKQLTVKESNIENLNTQVSEKSKCISEIKSKLEDKENALISSQKIIENNLLNIDELKLQSSSLEDALNKITFKLNEEINFHNSTKESKKQLQTKYDDFISRQNVLTGRLQSYEAEVTDLKTEISRLIKLGNNREETHNNDIKQLEQNLQQARRDVLNVTEHLKKVQQDKSSYQRQSAELKCALNSALAQLKQVQESWKVREPSRVTPSLPSPPPLHIENLTKLIEEATLPHHKNHPVTSLQSCLASLKNEVNTLQQQLHTSHRMITEDSELCDVLSDT